MKELGERLRILRESVKLSQVKMADLLGVKQSVFGNACEVCRLF